MSTQSISPFDRLVETIGSRAAIAEACGISVQAVGKWRHNIPSRRVIELERLSGGRVKRQQMRPDIYPDS